MNTKHATQALIDQPGSGPRLPWVLALVVDECFPSDTQVAGDAIAIAEKLAQRGCHVLLISKHQSGQRHQERIGSIKIHRIAQSIFNYFDQGKFLRILKLENVQIVHWYCSDRFMAHHLQRVHQIGLHTIYTVPGNLNISQKSRFNHLFRNILQKRYFQLLENIDDIVCENLALAKLIVNFTVRPQIHFVENIARPENAAADDNGHRRSIDTAIGQLLAIYAQDSAQLDPSAPRRDSQIRVARRRVCELCGLGTFASLSDSVVLNSDERALAHSYYRMWRCPGCLSLHALTRAVQEDYSPERPYRKRKLNPFNRKMFQGFHAFLQKNGLRNDHKVLICGLSSNLCAQVFSDGGQCSVEIIDPPRFQSEDCRTPNFDVVIFLEYLECAEDPEQLLTFARSRLKPGGLFVVHTPDAERISLSAKSRDRLTQPHRIHLFSRRILAAILRKNQFEVTRVYQRHLMDTYWPFLNAKAFEILADFGDGTVDAAIEFKFVDLVKGWWNLPRWVFWGILGGVFRVKSNLIVVSRKKNSNEPASTPRLALPPKPRHAHYRAIVLSPHLDDAVFSCGGRMAQLANLGPVLAVNVFTDFSHPPPWTRVKLGENMEEDGFAAAELGFESLFLNQPICICRTARYLAPSRLFGAEPHPEDLAYLPELTQRLEQLLATVTWDELYLPLGVGWHVDHILCYRASRRFHKLPGTWFYEDMPYSLIPHALERRLHELGFDGTVTVPESKSWLMDGIHAGTAVARSPIFRVLPRWVRKLIGTLVGSGFFAYYYRKRQRRTREEQSNWQAEELDISEVWRKKQTASFLYESQIYEFFHDMSDMQRHMRRYLESINSWKNYEWIERYWRKKTD